jgi:hypothetical protein
MGPVFLKNTVCRLRGRGRHFEHLFFYESLTVYCIYFYKCTYVFVMRSIFTEGRDCFYFADDGVSGAQVKGKSQAIAFFDEDPVFR